MTPFGEFTEYPIRTVGSNPEGITAGPDGNLWFIENHGNKIGKITPAGVVTEYGIPTANSDAVGITAGPDGNLWFTESKSNQIGRITPAGVITEYAIPTARSSPQGITAGRDGTVWFTEFASNQIGQITPAGAVTEYAIPTAMSFPSGIATGADGNLWFTENQSGKVGRWSPRLTVVPAAASVLQVAGYPSPVTAGAAGSFTVTAQDAYGNTVTNYSGTVHFSSGDAQAVLPADYTFTTADHGVHTFDGVFLETAGVQSLTATDTALAGLTGTQFGIQVNPAALNDRAGLRSSLLG